MADIFNEIEEEIRHDRSKAVWKKYGKYVIGLAVAIVLVTAGHTGWREYEKSVRVDRSDRFVAAVAKLGENDVESATNLFSTLGEDGGAGYGTLARFQAAALKAESGDKAGAVLSYDVISNDASIDELYRGLALVMAVMHDMDGGDAGALLDKIAPQLSDDAAWRFTARELAASLSANSGDLDKAKEYLMLITDDLKAPQGVRARASERLKAIGG